MRPSASMPRIPTSSMVAVVASAICTGGAGFWMVVPVGRSGAAECVISDDDREGEEDGRDEVKDDEAAEDGNVLRKEELEELSSLTLEASDDAAAEDWIVF